MLQRVHAKVSHINICIYIYTHFFFFFMYEYPVNGKNIPVLSIAGFSSTTWLVSINTLTRLANLFFQHLTTLFLQTDSCRQKIQPSLCHFQTLLSSKEFVGAHHFISTCYLSVNKRTSCLLQTFESTLNLRQAYNENNKFYLSKTKVPTQQFLISRLLSFRKSPNKPGG